MAKVSMKSLYEKYNTNITLEQFIKECRLETISIVNKYSFDFTDRPALLSATTRFSKDKAAVISFNVKDKIIRLETRMKKTETNAEFKAICTKKYTTYLHYCKVLNDKNLDMIPSVIEYKEVTAMYNRFKSGAYMDRIKELHSDAYVKKYIVQSKKKVTKKR